MILGGRNKLDQMDLVDSKQMHMHDLCWEIMTKKSLYNVISDLCKENKEVKVIEQCGNYMKLQIDRSDKKIGSLFSSVEDLKKKYKLADYSVNQTSLEQIFQRFVDPTFAESIVKFTLNKDGKLVRKK